MQYKRRASPLDRASKPGPGWQPDPVANNSVARELHLCALQASVAVLRAARSQKDHHAGADETAPLPAVRASAGPERSADAQAAGHLRGAARQ